MLYFYQSISPQPIENLHSYLDFFFTQLFAEVNPSYDHAFHITPDFQEIVDEYNQIDNGLSAVFNAYMGLTRPEKNLVRMAYKNNNEIQAVCNNRRKPVKFTKLPAPIRPSLTNLLLQKASYT